MLSAENKKERDKNDTKFLCISNYTLPAMNYYERVLHSYQDWS